MGHVVFTPLVVPWWDETKRCVAIYEDWEHKALVTSPVISDSEDTETGDITVVTENSIYEFENIGGDLHALFGRVGDDEAE